VQRYSLTERGKLLVAMLVVLFIVLPSIIIIILITTRDTTRDITPPISEPPGDVQQSSVEAGGTDSDLEDLDSSLTGPVEYDIEAGTLTFLYTPDQQTSIDSETNSLIGQLLTSPKNTDESKIAVEIPQLPDEETSKLTTVILNAFITHNVSVNDIVFFVYPPQSGAKTYEINVSFN